MAVLTDDEPRNNKSRAILVLLSGIALAAISSLVAYEFTFGGWGADFDDYRRGAVTAFIAFGVIISFAMIYIGAATYWSERFGRTGPQQYPTYRR